MQIVFNLRIVIYIVVDSDSRSVIKRTFSWLLGRFGRYIIQYLGVSH
jgi:hypothetical protein